MKTEQSVTKRPQQAAEYIGIKLTKLWELTRTDPEFPKPFKLGSRTTLYYTAEIDAYLQRKAEQQRKAA